MSNPAAATSTRRPSRVPGWSPVRRSRLLINVVTVAVTLLFSYFAFSNINLSLAWHALRTSDYLWLIPALIAFGAGMLFQRRRTRRRH